MRLTYDAVKCKIQSEEELTRVKCQFIVLPYIMNDLHVQNTTYTSDNDLDEALGRREMEEVSNATRYG